MGPLRSSRGAFAGALPAASLLLGLIIVRPGVPFVAVAAGEGLPPGLAGLRLTRASLAPRRPLRRAYHAGFWMMSATG